MKKVIFMTIAAGVIFISGGLSYAAAEDQGSGHHQMTQMPTYEQKQAVNTDSGAIPEKAVDAGNKICPVSGEKIVDNLKATYEYEGKIYNFCCPVCIDEFKKDPQKYIKKVEEELKGEEQAAVNK